jgi:hypothetical protein
MANPLYEAGRALYSTPFIGQAATLINPLGAIAHTAATNLIPGYAPTVGEEEEVGGQKKYYAGERYGYQSPESYRKIFGAFPKSVRTQLEDQQRARAAAGGESGSSRGDTDWQQTPTPPQDSTPPPAPTLPEPAGTEKIPQKEDQTPQDILSRLDKYLSPEFQQQLREQETEQFIRRSLLTSALAYRQTLANTRRQEALEKMRVWRDVQAAQIEANSRAMGALASTAWAAVTPNANTMTALGQQYQATMAPFQTFNPK